MKYSESNIIERIRSGSVSHCGYLLLIVFTMAACRDHTAIITDADLVNEWIYKSMASNYLWAGELVPIKEVDLKLGASSFFENTIRYRVDRSVNFREDVLGDRFSHIDYEPSKTRFATNQSSIEGAEKATKHNFGFDSRMFIDAQTGLIIYAQVLYTLPGSPAAAAGIARGDCFNSMNGVSMPMDRKTFESHINKESLKLRLFEPREVVKELRQADYYDSPVLFDSVFDISQRTGYLVYNHFTSGNNSRFNNQLYDVFGRFKALGVENLILDLRYNGGGELATSVLLASLIAREDILGKVLIYKEDNSSMGNPDRFRSDHLLPISELRGSNCNIQRLIVLTSSNTASASELVIHALKPYYNSNMTVVGERTVGKNLGGIKITNPRYEWVLNPITLRIYNCNKVSGYEGGIMPDVAASELSSFYNIGKFGDTQHEPLLARAVALINGESRPVGVDAKVRVDSGMRTELTIVQRDLTTDQIVIE